MAKAEERVYDTPAERLWQAARRAVSELGYSVTHTDSESRTISFNTGMSWKSWAGQDMTASVFDESPGRARIVLGGRRAQRGNIFGGGGQVYDWGERGKITRTYFDRLDRVLPEIPVDPTPQRQGPTTSDELERLAELHTSGVLDDDEFKAAKAKLLR
jgi:hypothetical protein